MDSHQNKELITFLLKTLWKKERLAGTGCPEARKPVHIVASVSANLNFTRCDSLIRILRFLVTIPTLTNGICLLRQWRMTSSSGRRWCSGIPMTVERRMYVITSAVHVRLLMNKRLITGMSISAFNARYHKEGLISVSSFNNYTNDKYVCFENDMIYDDMEKNFEVDMYI